MNTLVNILIINASISLCFLVYKLVFRKERNFQQLRFFLLFSILISALLPLNEVKIKVDFPFGQNKQKVLTAGEAVGYAVYLSENNSSVRTEKMGANGIVSPDSKLKWKRILMIVYLIVSIILISRLILQLTTLIIQSFTAKKVRSGNSWIIFNDRYRTTFSFFNRIFVHNDNSSKKEIEEIIAHEKIHVSQLHSIDLILIELLLALMWFNPFVWMIRNEIQLVHEYLADEGALSTGIDRLSYQALLINQVSEERLICLSSSFNHSLIKKRMIMMTKSKFNQRTQLKVLAIVPLAAVLFLAVACKNGQNKSDVVTAIEPVKMNVLYIGVDNPLKIAASGYKASDLVASIDNGTITGQNGEFIVHPGQPGSAIITVTSKGKEIQKTVFRVKLVPDPKSAIEISGEYRLGGEISKQELLDAAKIVAYMPDLEYDLSFDIVGFTIFVVIEGYVKEQTSKSGAFTKEQKDILNLLKSGAPVYFQDIKCKGPDGSIRTLATLNIRIK